MELLRRSEFSAWLLRRFKTTAELAAKLGVTRQTAHNLMTARTIPSYETCEKLGIEPAFLVVDKDKDVHMNTLDDFLSKRAIDQAQQSAAAESAARIRRLIQERGAATWSQLLASVEELSVRVGQIDGHKLEWNRFPFLKLEYVAATLYAGILIDANLKGCRIVFGRIPIATYIDDNPISNEVWDLTFGVDGENIVWNVNDTEIIGISSIQLAEQLIKRLVIYRDEYKRAFSNILM